MMVKMPVFTPEQIQWLHRTFPENTGALKDPNSVCIRLGQRDVIRVIEANLASMRAHSPK